MANDIIARSIAATAAADLEEFKRQSEEALAGKADLVDGKVPASQLPSYVDDVVEYADVAHFPETGESGKIYVALDTGYTYRWSGSGYIQIGGQDISAIIGNFAPEYDSTATYAAGDFCTHDNGFYVCPADISTAEEWNSSHWAQTNVASALKALKALVDSKQDILVSGENIKTINGKSVLGSGNLEIETNHPIPSSWDVSSTTAALCASIVADASAVKGMTYLGKINCSDLPGHLVQGEAIIGIISSGDANGKDIRITLTSADTAPYHWEYEYVRINGQYGSPAGWVGYQPELVSGSNIKTINGNSVLGSGDFATSGFEGYYYGGVFWKNSSHTNRLGSIPGKLYFDLASEDFYVYDSASQSFRLFVPPYEPAQPDSGVPGIVKLYSSEGYNEDGAMTQKAVTVSLKTKVEMDTSELSDDECVAFSVDLE